MEHPAPPFFIRLHVEYSDDDCLIPSLIEKGAPGTDYNVILERVFYKADKVAYRFHGDGFVAAGLMKHLCRYMTAQTEPESGLLVFNVSELQLLKMYCR